MSEANDHSVLMDIIGSEESLTWRIESVQGLMWVPLTWFQVSAV